ncbi:hypothetical protein [Paenibacillus abyssi]|uniref:Uncharacterized protein n=1 Tax=Paenibacillus abyssi TaxID=1340531 RepID=A0A917CGF9_9BACL|nr:hypothetical protein [Paenibacillus abyssi]GGF88295.1 hypothetical protein GCM10010916_02030 [Paenibacillus abyssi]
MKPVSDAIAALNRLPIDGEVVMRTVWSDGKVIRRYNGQDSPGFFTRRTSAERGFRKMTVILIEEVPAE